MVVPHSLVLVAGHNKFSPVRGRGGKVRWYEAQAYYAPLERDVQALWFFSARFARIRVIKATPINKEKPKMNRTMPKVLSHMVCPFSMSVAIKTSKAFETSESPGRRWRMAGSGRSLADAR
jgi:hypothetical protein